MHRIGWYAEKTHRMVHPSGLLSGRCGVGDYDRVVRALVIWPIGVGCFVVFPVVLIEDVPELVGTTFGQAHPDPERALAPGGALQSHGLPTKGVGDEVYRFEIRSINLKSDFYFVFCLEESFGEHLAHPLSVPMGGIVGSTMDQLQGFPLVK